MTATDTNTYLGLNPFFEARHPKMTPQEKLALKKEILQGIPNARAGYRSGVLLVPISPRGRRTKVVRLDDLAEMQAHFRSRVKGEDPRKMMEVIVNHYPLAKSSWAILYQREVLAENKEPSTGCDWDLIDILDCSEFEPDPMTPETLMYNHFGGSGGTNTQMTAEEFQDALRTSWEFWKDRAMSRKKSFWKILWEISWPSLLILPPLLMYIFLHK